MTAIRQYADDDWSVKEKEDLAAAIDWEGGIYETINGYGMSASRASGFTTDGKPLPREIQAAWEAIEAIEPYAQKIRDWLDNRELTS